MGVCYPFLAAVLIQNFSHVLGAGSVLVVFCSIACYVWKFRKAKDTQINQG